MGAANKEPHARIRRLKCFPEVVARLKSGESTYKIAPWIQDECGEALDISCITLRAQLATFRREMKSLVLLEARQPAFVQNALEKVKKGLDELDELEKIYEIQKQRIEDMHKLEKKLTIANRITGHEIRIAAELLRTRHQIKMDLGLEGGRQLGTLTIAPGTTGSRPELHYDTQSRYGTEVASVIDVPEKRQRVLDAVRRAMAVTEVKERNPDNVITLESTPLVRSGSGT